jgi:hypothetical protein
MASRTVNPAPLFSEASRAYQDKLRSAHGEGYDELNYLRHRTEVFLALMEDKPVNLYGEEDLQQFIDQVAFMPAVMRACSSFSDSRLIANRPP